MKAVLKFIFGNFLVQYFLAGIALNLFLNLFFQFGLSTWEEFWFGVILWPFIAMVFVYALYSGVWL